jgi:hypothetical protein
MIDATCCEPFISVYRLVLRLYILCTVVVIVVWIEIQASDLWQWLMTLTYDFWLMTYDLWLMTFDLWLMTYDLWLMTYDLWLMTSDLWLFLTMCYVLTF